MTKTKLILSIICCLLMLGLIFIAIRYYIKIEEEKKFINNNSLRVAIITDIDHCPSRRPVLTESVDSFLGEANKKKADFIVSLGDNASHRLGDCSETADMDARAIAEKLRSLEKPAYFVIGDHDIESDEESYQAWLETSRKDNTFYSFDAKNVHIVFLDTVLGGEPMSPACEEKEDCRTLLDRLAELKSEPYPDYRLHYPDARKDMKEEKNLIKEAIEMKNKEIDQTRSWGIRDIGRISDKELGWLKKDLDDTQLKRVVVFSDHPLFPFSTEKKSYNINNGDQARKILEESGKQVVAISGEAHTWHEEMINGIQYYIIDEFPKDDGTWAFFAFLPEKFELTKAGSKLID